MKNEYSYLINQTDYFPRNALVIVETTKPIMLVKQTGFGEYVVIYLTQDKCLKKNRKSIYFKEYFAGEPNLNDFHDFLKNELSVYNFLGKTLRKSRIVKANSKVFPSTEIDDISVFKNCLPKSDITLKDMPMRFSQDLEKLIITIEKEIRSLSEYNLKDALDFSGEENFDNDQEMINNDFELSCYTNDVIKENSYEFNYY